MFSCSAMTWTRAGGDVDERKTSRPFFPGWEIFKRLLAIVVKLQPDAWFSASEGESTVNEGQKAKCFTRDTRCLLEANPPAPRGCGIKGTANRRQS